MRLILVLRHSWQAGTQAETIIELQLPKLGVFSSSYLATTIPYTTSQLSPVVKIATAAVKGRQATGRLWGMDDGSAGDAASLGVAVLLAGRVKASGEPWATAAAAQLNLLLTKTPRLAHGTGTGAISHRADVVSLWSDFIYMVPPFLPSPTYFPKLQAYYGAITGNLTLIQEAYTQISLYRSVLYSSNVSLWKHVYSPPSSRYFNDSGHWSTGNGWAAAGMLRVLATIKNSPHSSRFETQQTHLETWITEIHTGMANHLPSSGIFYNYVDKVKTTTTSFPDASGTALFSATVYRFMTLSNPPGYSKIVAAAEKARKALYWKDGATHFDNLGWLKPVVNPYAFSEAGSRSDEAQSFVLQMNHNWLLWKSEGSKY
ncbi:hypothetical protein FRB98_006035 [Tulasnella sp. 332]|nr:hypothetical protein FRB98_006035 [Tulasnella sp. 332]